MIIVPSPEDVFKLSSEYPEEDPELTLKKKAVQYWAMMASKLLQGIPEQEAEQILFDTVIDLEEMCLAGYLTSISGWEISDGHAPYMTYRICKFEQSDSFGKPRTGMPPMLEGCGSLVYNIGGIGYIDINKASYAEILHVYWNQDQYDLMKYNHFFGFFLKALQKERRKQVMVMIVEVETEGILKDVIALDPINMVHDERNTPERLKKAIMDLRERVPVMITSTSELEKSIGEFIIQNGELLDYGLLFGNK